MKPEPNIHQQDGSSNPFSGSGRPSISSRELEIKLSTVTEFFSERGRKLNDVVLGPGVGAGVGLGLGVVGGAGLGGSGWNQPSAVFGIGMGCGVGVGVPRGAGVWAGVRCRLQLGVP